MTVGSLENKVSKNKHNSITGGIIDDYRMLPVRGTGERLEFGLEDECAISDTYKAISSRIAFGQF